MRLTQERREHSRLAVAGLTLLTVGVTVSSMLSGAQSGAYYAAILGGLLLCLPFALAALERRLLPTLLLVSLPLVGFALQQLFVDPELAIGAQNPSMLLPLGMMAAILAATIAGALPEDRFRELMTYVAIAHVGLGALIIWQGSASPDAARFAADDVAVAVWGEIGLGMIIAAVLSGQLWLLAASIAAGGYLIYVTQMRGAGVAGAVALVLVLVGYIARRWGRKAVALILIAGAAAGVLAYATLADTISTLLLLDDPYRGLGAGLSGRFSNWQDGVGRFLASPIIGYGQADFYAAATHNGFLKILADYGLLLAVPALFILSTALRRAWRAGRADLLAAILGYVVFIGSAPRYINFQVMPLVALMAIAYSVVHFRTARRATQPAALRRLSPQSVYRLSPHPIRFDRREP